jgi:hypothetical protein
MSDSYSSVLWVGVNDPEGRVKLVEFPVVAAVKTHGEMRALACGQQVEAVPGQPGDCRQVDRTKVREALPE